MVADRKSEGCGRPRRGTGCTVQCSCARDGQGSPPRLLVAVTAKRELHRLVDCMETLWSGAKVQDESSVRDIGNGDTGAGQVNLQSKTEQRERRGSVWLQKMFDLEKATRSGRRRRPCAGDGSICRWSMGGLGDGMKDGESWSGFRLI